jgi:hypothetical protein
MNAPVGLLASTRNWISALTRAATTAVRSRSARHTATLRGNDMNMQQIRYFLALSEERNFRRAARKCNIAQPSLTNAIKALEQELGGPLFWRKRPRIEMSTLGHAVLPHFTRIAYELESMYATAKGLAGTPTFPAAERDFMMTT